jgi:GT2 family glycosyltransferase
VRARLVIVNWNGRAWLERCLAAVEGECRGVAEVVVVDNGSTDDSVAWLAASCPWVRVVAVGENAGFSRGNNLGVAGATTEFLVFLNNDTEVEPGWLAALIAAADRDPSVGLVTSQLVYFDRPDLVDSAGDGYLRCGGAFKVWHGRSASTAPGSREVFGACGGACLIRRALFERLGGFDERLFLIYEDVDLSYRARLTGARIVYAADAVVRHRGSATVGRASATAVFYGQRNLEWVWLQNTPGRLLWRSFLSHAIYSCAGVAAYARHGHAWTAVRAKLAALAGIPVTLSKRRLIQRGATADPERLWQLMEGDWIGLKRREKSFDLR